MRTETFKQKLNSTLRDNAINRFIAGKNKGKIDYNSLYKISHSSKIFKQKEERKGKDYSVTFLLDISGSMGGGRLDISSEAIQDLTKIFTDLNIPNYVYVFAGDVFKVDLKRGEDYINAIEYLYEAHSGGTNDAYALHVVGNEICKLNKKNILIVLTDGAGNNIEGSRQVLNGIKLGDLKNAKSVIKGLHKRYEDLEIVCLSIYSDHAPKVYGGARTVVINDLEQVRKGVIKLINRIIKRG